MHRPSTSRLAGPIAAILIGVAAGPGLGAGRVDLQLVTEPRVPITAQQEWLRRLSEAGVTNLRIRTMRSTDEVGIVTRGTAGAPVYSVTGVITSAGDVVLPGARFRTTDAHRLARWLDELAQYGPSKGGPTKSAFGLSPRQFEALHKGLALPAAVSTEGVPRRRVIEQLAKRVGVPIRVEPRMLATIEEDDVVGEELSGLSCGTALAYAARPLGWCLVPGGSGRVGVECALAKARPDTKAWPIGWEPEKRPGDVLPALFEFLNVNVQGVDVTRFLAAMQERLEVPVLVDHNALARHGIEPQESFINLPQTRTSYTLLIKKALYQAGLKYELRVDERDKPFLWVTTRKPI